MLENLILFSAVEFTVRESYLLFYEKSQAVLEKSLKNTCERVHPK